MVQFPTNFILALIIASVHLLISFKLTLPGTLKNKFRTYSVLVNAVFIVFLGSFLIYFKNTDTNQGINFYYNGLSTLYFLLFIPLGTVLLWLFSKLMVKADIYSVFAKYVVVIGAFLGMLGTIFLGYSVFVFAFYGFAP